MKDETVFWWTLKGESSLPISEEFGHVKFELGACPYFWVPQAEYRKTQFCRRAVPDSPSHSFATNRRSDVIKKRKNPQKEKFLNVNLSLTDWLGGNESHEDNNRLTRDNKRLSKSKERERETKAEAENLSINWRQTGCE